MQVRQANPASEGLMDIGDMLRLVRQNLGLDVAFVGEFVGEQRVFRHVDSAVPGPVREGGPMCWRTATAPASSTDACPN